MLNRSLTQSLPFLIFLAVISGCGESVESSGGAPSLPATPRTVFGGDRPVTIDVPSTYDPSHPTPLIVVLHGYSANGHVQEQYLRVAPLVEQHGILVIAPDGTRDSSGN